MNTTTPHTPTPEQQFGLLVETIEAWPNAEQKRAALSLLDDLQQDEGTFATLLGKFDAHADDQGFGAIARVALGAK